MLWGKVIANEVHVGEVNGVAVEDILARLRLRLLQCLGLCHKLLRLGDTATTLPRVQNLRGSSRIYQVPIRRTFDPTPVLRLVGEVKGGFLNVGSFQQGS